MFSEYLIFRKSISPVFQREERNDFVLYKGKEYVIFVQYNQSTIKEPFKT